MEQKTLSKISGEIDRLQEFTRIRANLLELASVLLSDRTLSIEEVACDLLANVESLNKLEGDFNRIYINSGFRTLTEYCELTNENKTGPNSI